MRSRARIVAAVVSLLVVLAGCGGGGPSASDLYAQMQKASAEATSVRIVGSLTVDGKATQIDLRGTRDGSNQTITMTEEGAGTATFLTVDGQEYLKADRAYWAAIGAEETADVVGDKFVPTGNVELGNVLNPGVLLDEMFADEDAFNLSTKVEEGDLDGQAAYRVSDRVGSDGTELWVSADGKAHLLKIAGPFEGQPMSLAFSEWNAVEPVTAPPADQLVTI